MRIVADKDNKTENHKGFNASRRRFVKNTGIAVGGIASGALLGGLLTNQVTTEDIPELIENSVHPMEARMFFSRFADFVVLEQATERIYPKDDNGPGAIQLGVPYFIDRQLAGPWGINATDYRQGPFDSSDAETVHSRLTRGDLFINGLRKMNELSQERFGTTFNEANEDQQIEILEEFEAGKVNMRGVSSSSFFELLRSSVLEGAYSDPLYGGNRNMEGWRMKEFPGAVPSYADQIDSEEFIKMDPVSLTDYQQKS